VLEPWDTVSTGPRGTDIIPTLQAPRFGFPPAERDDFIAAYGRDIRNQVGYRTCATSASCRPCPPFSATAMSTRIRTVSSKLGSIRIADDHLWAPF
jgi:hypothetical protein